MGNRRTRAAVVVGVAVVLGSAVVAAAPRPVVAGDRAPSTAAAHDAVAPTLPATPTLPPSPLPVPAAPCQPPQLQVSEHGFKVALGTIAGTYRVETNGPPCTIAADDSALLAAIDGGAPPVGAVLRSATGPGNHVVVGQGTPAVVDITFPNPNLQAPPPVPPLPSPPTVTVPPTTLPALPPTTLPKNAALQPLTSALNTVQALVLPTTTVPPPPPPPPPPDNGPTTYPPGTTGFDISWPQCGGNYPPQAGVAVVGVNDGHAFTTNPCLQSEAAWAAGARELYINLNSPSGVDGTDSDGPWGHCAPSDAHCLAYTYGWNAAAASYNAAASQGVRAKTWWLDVEVVGKCAPQFPTGGNGYWSCDQAANMATVQGALDALRQRNLVAGIYSTNYQYGQITGGYTPDRGAPPNWLAGASSSNTGSWCSGSHDFAGGPPWLLQFSPQPWDRDQAC